MKGNSVIRLRTSKIRHLRRMTQKQLAHCAHLSKTTISNLESGKQTKIELTTIAKLCHALECHPDDLFEFIEQPNSHVIQSQKAALKKYIGCLDYDIPFDPQKLDEDLANIVNNKKCGGIH